MVECERGNTPVLIASKTDRKMLESERNHDLGMWSMVILYKNDTPMKILFRNPQYSGGAM